MSLLNNLTSIVSKSSKRIGRGYGSGKGGHTSSRGMKGQRSRVGSKIPLWFEGGQLPLTKRLPMLRGKGRFNVLVPTAEVTLTDIEKMESKVISLETLKLEKVINARFRKAKLVSTGKLTRKVTVEIPVSAGSKKAIESAGGSTK
ncbi:MAG: 50S ribosomal protein L15 [Candidatus Pacebacteria bacterium]|jgi:large subunit ribosomal protein L15|nr:50S ribosomal protein L15 [Candidatus Paceibacterota bacterium]MBT3511516.1 50S ribosomal protein L15 [Candidatus Paceibacterota bacterium]MBT4005014.1 50S ribosomal protein L15 [Candidatus Paceibacterota bacterium]MBT4358790.1 50S ribosomal protein L15 [Candidatus Paceibacterota bacterium]MBT4680598.1 50S ribosomal protein L15 [Candidatus Paceibacterota bacterium]